MDIPDIGIPADYGFPEKFASFRRTQSLFLGKVMDDVMTGSPRARFTGSQQVVGSGKTGCIMGLHQIRRMQNPEHRTAVLTVTKQLQQQIHDDFHTMGNLRLVKGRSNFECEVYRDCEVGADNGCAFKRSESCSYQAQYSAGHASPVVVPNLSYWISINRYGKGLGPINTLVIDEAHSLLGALTDAATATFAPQTGPQGEFERDQLKPWQDYANRRLRQVEREISSASEERATKLRAERDKLNIVIAASVHTHVVDVNQSDWVTISPVWPADTAEDDLYLGIEEVLLLSGTLLPKILEYVGAHVDSAYETYPMEFDPKRWRIQLVDVGRIQHNMSQTTKAQWLSAICQILSFHPDEKGIIHPVSYARMRQIRNMLPENLRKRLITHEPGEVEQAFDLYRSSDKPVVLCSPAATTGVDFPEEEQNFCIIPKMPRPDHTALPRLHAARRARDASYSDVEMMNTFCQSIGRLKRRNTQRSAVYVLDSHARYLLNKENADVLYPGWVTGLLDWGRKKDPKPRKITF